MAHAAENVIYNVALTLSTFLINLVLFPYVSRVLGVDYVGKIGFANNVITYFSLFSIWGVRSLGIREIAACGSDVKKRSEVYSSLLSFLIITSVIVTSIFVIAAFTVPRFRSDLSLFIIGSISLFFTSFLIEWFYQGLENFKYITIRTVVIRVIYAFLVFLLVKSPKDYLLYFVLTVTVVLVNSVINLFYSRNFAQFSFKFIKLRSFLQPLFSLGIYNIVLSMYTTFNVVYLGFVCPDSEVGYYYTSTKIYQIITGIVAAFTGVMMPRISSLLSNNQEDQANLKIKQSIELILNVSLPLSIFFFLMAPNVVHLISGVGYEGAVLPMQIIMPVIVISSMAQIWVLQVLIPRKKDNIVLISATIGAVVGIVFNLLLVRRFGAVGSAVVLLLSETCGNLYSFLYVFKHKYIDIGKETLLKVIPYSIPFIAICLIGSFLNDWLSLFFCMFLSSLYFCLYHICFNKKGIIGEYLLMVKKKLLGGHD